MLNVCFSESAMFSLKIAFHKNISEHWKVICIPDDLSVGDIANINDFASRRCTLASFIRDEDYVDTRCKSRCQEFFNEIYKHEEITIWYGNSPLEFCGFLYTIWLLRNKNVTLKGIYCSRKIETGPNAYAQYKFAGEIAPEVIKTFLSYREEITDKEKKDYAKLWEKLVIENGELRVYKDSTMVTEDISYYDQIILNHISSVFVCISNIIGEIIGFEELGIGDEFFATRIKELIRQGILEQEGNNENFYRNRIRKANYYNI